MERDFNKIKNFAVYYGTGCIEQLAEFDVVIIEPAGHTPKEVKTLKEAGVFVLAYLSVVELPSCHESFISFQEDLLMINHAPVTNETFNTRYMNLQSPGWMAHLWNQANRYMAEQGYDGLFLDTVGNLENPVIPPGVMFEQLKAYINFLEMLKKRYPGCLLLQNNGMERLASYSKEFIDGICWENPSFDKEEKIWSKKILKKLIVLKKEHKVKVFLLTEDGNKVEVIKRIAYKYNYLYYYSSGNYRQLPIERKD